jgi:predicted short-subunit dehydrogenase-like oxidoreductase (DUF2520 family)
MNAPLRPPAGEPEPRAAGLTVGVVGAGRVGAALGAALHRAGHRVVAASGDSPASRDRIVRLLPAARHATPAEVARLATDLLVVAVPDDALVAVVAGLASVGALRGGQVVAHTSGAHGLAVLTPAAALGARPLALHPAMTFTGAAGDADLLTGGISFGVTAPADLRPLARRLIADLGGTAEWVAEADRPIYHAALAHGANHLVTVVNDALDRLRDAGVVHPELVLAPLVRAALENTLRMGDSALTGPVSRGDAGTVARHLERLAQVAPESVAAYRVLARRTADRAIAAGRLRAVDAEPLLGVLAEVRLSGDGRPRPEPRLADVRLSGDGRPRPEPRLADGREGAQAR